MWFSLNATNVSYCEQAFGCLKSAIDYIMRLCDVYEFDELFHWEFTKRFPDYNKGKII